jgi:hypothetical protein
MWYLPAGPEARVVNLRSVTTGNALDAVEPEAGASTPAAGQGVGADAKQTSRQPATPADSEASSPAPPELGDCDGMDGARNTVGKKGSFGIGRGNIFEPNVVYWDYLCRDDC